MKANRLILPFLILFFTFSLVSKDGQLFNQYRFFDSESLSEETTLPSVLTTYRFSKSFSQFSAVEQFYAATLPSTIVIEPSFAQHTPIIRSMAHDRFINFTFTGTSPPKFEI